MALAVLTMLFIGVAMVADISTAHSLLLAIHKPLGVVIALLVVVRIGLRRYYGVPAMPASVPGWQQTVAHLTHLVHLFTDAGATAGGLGDAVGRRFSGDDWRGSGAAG
ncbi:hypothetical protein E05_04590 [Plautia stali symbiont]|nr:hypothetical protein E05_04590 [Plautia stali symbiont]